MDDEYQNLMQKLTSDKFMTTACYKTNNKFAYLYDLTKEFPLSESKCYNFVPTYDPWCLYCNNKNCTLRCSKCKFVFFCNEQCQKKSWSIHKHHCKRDLFCLCIVCGKDNPSLRCDKCPVKYCSNQCKDKIEHDHKDYDCDTFSDAMTSPK